MHWGVVGSVYKEAMLDSFALICCAQFHSYSVLAPYTTNNVPT